MAAPAYDLFAVELTPETVLATLRAQCVGEGAGLTVHELYAAVTGRRGTPGGERRLRHIVEALRSAGHPLCATPTHGYYIAADAGELDRACEFLYGRAMTSLRQVSALRRVALPDLRGQLRLPPEGGDSGLGIRDSEEQEQEHATPHDTRSTP